MIDPAKAISFKLVPAGDRTVAIAEAKISASVIVARKYYSAPLPTSTNKEIEEHLRREVWHMLYGDLQKRFCELLNTFYRGTDPCHVPYGFFEQCDEFRALLSYSKQNLCETPADKPSASSGQPSSQEPPTSTLPPSPTP